VIDFLAQSSDITIDTMLKVIGSWGVPGVMILIFYLVHTGKFVPGRYYDSKCAECDAQRVRAEVAEGNLLKALMTGDRIVSATEKLANHTPPATADRGRQP
jgi:hypothetical protein